MVDETFGNYLRRRFHEWTGKQLGKTGRIPSQADFAKWLDVKTTSLSTWMNDQKTPTGDSVDKLASRLGVEVYDRLGLPRRMPRDKKLNTIASLWDRLDENGQNELYERAKNLAERRDEGNTATA